MNDVIRLDFTNKRFDFWYIHQVCLMEVGIAGKIWHGRDKIPCGSGSADSMDLKIMMMRSQVMYEMPADKTADTGD